MIKFAFAVGIPVVAILVVLQICGVIHWPMAAILAPFWAPIALALAIILGICLVGALIMAVVLFAGVLSKGGRKGVRR